ncbi:MAG: hypothetical protein EOR94_02135 [Mesorhizobium sp.]|nr:MAG: hypothetical protein EOR94_02135 [Mesorhizobium sp.]
MTHSTAVLFAQAGNWLLAWTRESQPPEQQPKSPTPVLWDAERDRLPPRDESFYWA